MSNNANNEAFKGLFMQNDRYGYEFDETPNVIGRGTYGTVFKAKNRIDGKDYAIKKILITSAKDFEEKIKELIVWAKLDCDYFVQYRSSWIEVYNAENFQNFTDSISAYNGTTVITYDETDSANSGHPAILHIQMDLCSFTLKDAMVKVNTYFNIPNGDILTPIGYYIASELLIEILESINYLHNQNIIHRDLKPSNILISKGINGKFVKISDFGIAAFHRTAEESHTQLRGTLKYMAPEVFNSRKYDTKADVYSIGVMTQEMFNVDINKTVITSDDKLLLNKYENIMKLINELMSIKISERPNCDKILNDKHLWAYSFKDIENYIETQEIVVDLEKLFDIDNNFVQNFIKTKYKLRLKNICEIFSEENLSFLNLASSERSKEDESST